MEFILNFNFLNLFYFFASMGAVFFVAEFIGKFLNPHPEYSRKFSHIFFGLSIFYFSFVLGKEELIFSFFVITLLTIFSSFLKPKSIYSIERKSFGTILYPFSFFVLSFLLIPENADIFRFCILILTFSDAFAALFGVRFGKKIKKYQKSFLGSFVFFVITFFIFFFYTETLSFLVVFKIFLSTIFLTLVEFLSLKGLDNFFLPLFSALLLLFLF